MLLICSVTASESPQHSSVKNLSPPDSKPDAVNCGKEDLSVAQSMQRHEKPPLHAPAEKLRVKLPDRMRAYNSHQSLNSIASGHSQGYEYPARYRKKVRQDKLKSAKMNANPSASKLKGAPSPSRDVFVYRVEKGTEVKDLKDYLENANVTVREVTKVSREESKYDSFKVETTVSDMYSLLEPDFWPTGIQARRFFRPRNKDNSDRQ